MEADLISNDTCYHKIWCFWNLVGDGHVVMQQCPRILTHILVEMPLPIKWNQRHNTFAKCNNHFPNQITLDELYCKISTVSISISSPHPSLNKDGRETVNFTKVNCNVDKMDFFYIKCHEARRSRCRSSYLYNSDVIMGAMASQIAGVSIVCSSRDGWIPLTKGQ